MKPWEYHICVSRPIVENNGMISTACQTDTRGIFRSLLSSSTQRCPLCINENLTQICLDTTTIDNLYGPLIEMGPDGPIEYIPTQEKRSTRRRRQWRAKLVKEKKTIQQLQKQQQQHSQTQDEKQ